MLLDNAGRLASSFVLAALGCLTTSAYAGTASNEIVVAGPIEAVGCKSNTFKVLGVSFRATQSNALLDICASLADTPFQFVAVSSAKKAVAGVFPASKIQVYSEVEYVPGVTLVYVMGSVSSQQTSRGEFGIAGSKVLAGASAVPALAQRIEVIGTQPVMSGVIVASAIASVSLSNKVPIDVSASGIVGSGVAANGIVGSGLQLNGIVGSGSQSNGIVGSGADLNGIVGSGAEVKGIVGSGSELNGIVGSGLQLSGIVGSGSQTNGIVGSGKQVNGIVGSGSQVNGIVGSGMQKNGIVGSGSQVNGIVGSGVQSKGIVGSGAQVNGIVGSGVQSKGIVGSGAN